MEMLSSLTTLDGRNELVCHASNRLSIRATQVVGWFRDKGRQIRYLPGNEDLVSAVFSAEKTPVEGTRYRIGECVRIYGLDGECRRFKICGVQCGGFSNVYTVIDLDEMRPYCLKENRATLGDERRKNEKLAVEAEISLRLGTHPNLVTTYSAFFIRDRLFILTEYLPAASLDLQLKAGTLSIETALKYAVHICRAMNFARSVLPGFVHGDIKPGNCLITSSGDLKLGISGSPRLIDLGRTA